MTPPEPPGELRAALAHVLLAEHFRQRAEALGLPVVTIDGTRSLDEIVALVDAHFAPFLRGAPGSTGRYADPLP